MGKISNYARVLKAKLQDIFVIDSTDSNITTTKSVTVEQIGNAICGEQVHATLETDDQTIIGGINEVNNLITYADVSIGNVSIGVNGYADISANANIPATPTGYKVLFAVMTNFGSISSKNGGITIFCPHQGEYWVGSVANDSITGLEIRIVYIKN